MCVCVGNSGHRVPFFSFYPADLPIPFTTHTHTTDKLCDSEEKTVRQGMIALARVTDDSQNKGAERAAATAATKEIYAN